jgi:hypothetical protein
LFFSILPYHLKVRAVVHSVGPLLWEPSLAPTSEVVPQTLTSTLLASSFFLAVPETILFTHFFTDGSPSLNFSFTGRDYFWFTANVSVIAGFGVIFL